MEMLITGIHYIICLFLIIVILLQAGKGADIGAAFGAGGSQTLFGPRGAATFLNKMTAVVAIGFLATSLMLVSFSRSPTSRSVLEKVPVAAPGPQTPPAKSQPQAPESEPN